MATAAWMKARMDQTVTGQTVTSRDQYGDITFATAITYPARVDATQHTVKGPDGREVLARTLVLVGTSSTGGDPSLTVESKITLPDGSTPPILSVNTVRAVTGFSHQEVSCG